MAKQVPVEAPWTAKRAAEWDSHSIAWWLDRSGIRSAIGRDLFEMAVQGLFPGDLERRVVPQHAVPRAGARQPRRAVLDRGRRPGEPGRRRRRDRWRKRMADDLGDAVRLNAPVRSITQHDDHVMVETGELVISARHAVVTVPPALALEISFDPDLPDDRLTLYRNYGRGPGVEDARRLRRAVLARRRLQRSDLPTRIRGGGDDRRVTAVGHAGRARVVHVRPDRATRRRPRPGRAPARGARRADGPARAARRVARGVRRDRVVGAGVDARLLDGALPPGNAHALRARCSGSRSDACTGPAPRPPRRRTARWTAPCVPASAPRPRSSTAS